MKTLGRRAAHVQGCKLSAVLRHLREQLHLRLRDPAAHIGAIAIWS